MVGTTPITVNQIHLVPREYNRAYYPMVQNIYMEMDSTISNLDFLKLSVHELLHYFSYNSFFVNKNNEPYKQHRGGLKISLLKKKIYFPGWMRC